MSAKILWLGFSLLLMAAGGVYTLWQAYVYIGAADDLGISVMSAVKIILGIALILVSTILYGYAKALGER